MTVRDVLEETVKILNGIQIPVSMADQIARPVLGCVSNLNACINAIDEETKKREEKEPEIAMDVEEVPSEEMHNGNEYGE